MNRKIYNIHNSWSLLLLLFVVCSCASEIDEWQTDAKETPIEFEFLMPDDGQPTTRTKTAFVDGNKVYVTAEVTLADGAAKVESTVLEWKSGKFQPAADSKRLTWPENAVSAMFRAYYLPETHPTPPTGDGSSVTIPLNELRIDNPNANVAYDDLLLAQQKIVNINGVVTLRFAHTTTRLRFNGLKESTKITTLKLIPQGDDFSVNNQLVISYSAAGGYTHKFVNDGQDKGITITKDKGKTTADFFLNVTAEWEGRVFEFRQDIKEAGDTSTELPKVTVLLDKTSKFSTMKKGRAYRLTFYSGSYNNTVEEEKWYKDKEDPIIFDTASAIQDYFKNEGKNGLTQDLDFNNILLDESITIEFPSTRGIELKRTFEGNYFTIRNVYVKNGLFNAIPSGISIKNLRLENVKVIADGVDAAGLLAPSNAGTIDNVRISGSNQIGTQNVSSVGGLVGINTGTIEDVQLSGALLMEPYMESDKATKAFAVGGLVGSNTGAITNCEINAGGLLQPAGIYIAGEANVGGMVGSHVGSNVIIGCTTSVRVDATRLTARTSYVGGFCGVNKGNLSNKTGSTVGAGNKATGEVKGASFLVRSATGGFLGYTTSTIAVVNGCGATGDVTESACDKATATTPELYTGGFCGFSEVDLTNTYSVGALILTNTTIPVGTVRRKGALTGLISADKTISNSFSITDEPSGNKQLTFSGSDDLANICKARNSHLQGKMLTEQGVVDQGTDATIARLNNAVSGTNGYWSWNKSAVIYGGVPYIVK